VQQLLEFGWPSVAWYLRVYPAPGPGQNLAPTLRSGCLHPA